MATQVRQIGNTQSTITVKTEHDQELVLHIVAEDCGNYAVNWIEDEDHKAGVFVDGEQVAADRLGQELYESSMDDTFDGPDARFQCRKTDNSGSMNWVEIKLNDEVTVEELTEPTWDEVESWLEDNTWV